jgi:hypothetical protein
MKSLDSGLRRNDVLMEFQTFYEIVKIRIAAFSYPKFPYSFTA